MNESKGDEMTGELTRKFWKHKVYNTLHVVEMDETGTVLAATTAAAATACRHRLSEYRCTIEEGAEIEKHHRDYELLEPLCSDPAHLLSEIGAAEVDCQAAQEAYEAAHRHAKSLKEIFEGKTERVRQLVRDATNPKPLPLFETPAA